MKGTTLDRRELLRNVVSANAPTFRFNFFL